MQEELIAVTCLIETLFDLHALSLNKQDLHRGGISHVRVKKHLRRVIKNSREFILCRTDISVENQPQLLALLQGVPCILWESHSSFMNTGREFSISHLFNQSA